MKADSRLEVSRVKLSAKHKKRWQASRRPAPIDPAPCRSVNPLFRMAHQAQVYFIHSPA